MQILRLGEREKREKGKSFVAQPPCTHHPIRRDTTRQ
jgi:hypothetical protein